MNLTQLIAPDRVICLPSISSKKRLLEKLSQLLALGALELNHGDIFNRLIERERLGSTGLGHGVALPHGRIADLDHSVGAFIKLDQAIDFDSTDGQPTDLLFALLVPEFHTEEHLQILASLAGMFSNMEFCKQLRQCSNNEELFRHLSGWEQASPFS
ncbi:MAG: PTS sugar transporter subunit IIA [Gammaproteobacteria bacterium]|jgi:nitrogen PTS system EIIA component|nr:PTS sugar transporter subunit IIA [Gammaproteobacteria bacterium]